MLEKFNKILNGIKNHRRTFLLKDDYFSLVHFLIGFEIAFKEERQEKELYSFQEWFDLESGKRNNLHWCFHILKILASDNEERAIELTINFFEKYIKELEGNYSHDL